MDDERMRRDAPQNSLYVLTALALAGLVMPGVGFVPRLLFGVMLLAAITPFLLHDTSGRDDAAAADEAAAWDDAVADMQAEQTERLNDAVREFRSGELGGRVGLGMPRRRGDS